MSESYQEIRDSFKWDRPKKFNFARDVIDKWAAQDNQKMAMLWVDDAGLEKRISFEKIRKTSCQAANLLKKAGVKRGDTVIVMLGRQVAWWEVITACIRMGVVVSSGTTQLSAKDIVYRVNSTDASCVITESSCAAKVDQAISDCPTLIARVLVEASRDDWLDYDALSSTESEQFDTVDTEGLSL